MRLNLCQVLCTRNYGPESGSATKRSTPKMKDTSAVVQCYKQNISTVIANNRESTEGLHYNIAKKSSNKYLPLNYHTELYILTVL